MALSYILYSEVAKQLGISTRSVSNFATRNNIRRGSVVVRGRERGVLNRQDYDRVLETKNYLNDQEMEVSWS
tara:strand:+ start:224 stop:439 length:216 start_codon:yes stop_codon:yes gene_type:complete